MKTRDQIAKEECTCNPIFLFQKGIVRVYPDSPIEYDSKLDTTVYTKNGEPISNDQIIDEGYGWIEWYTEHVWSTREEAEEWGRTHAYRYRASDGKDGKPGKDWQVFCVPCCGVLPEILLTHENRVTKSHDTPHSAAAKVRGMNETGTSCCGTQRRMR